MLFDACVSEKLKTAEVVFVLCRAVYIYVYESEANNNVLSGGRWVARKLETKIELGFSSVASLKTKYRWRLNIEPELRVTVFKIRPRFGKLCAPTSKFIY